MQQASAEYEVGSVTHPGRLSQRNQDSCLVRTDVGLWAVADGMGGHEAGEIASQAVVEALDAIVAPASAADLLEQSRERVLEANRRIIDLSAQRGGVTIGTTVAILLIRDDYFACVWAGDSRVYSIKSNEISQLSVDHTELEELIASGALSPAEVRDWPNNVITRAVGVVNDPELDLVTGPVTPGETFVVCSDGLTKHLSNEEILLHVSTRQPQAACDAMLELALQRGGHDNLTIIIVRIAATRHPTNETTVRPTPPVRPEWRT